jgi:hypothetical protein
VVDRHVSEQKAYVEPWRGPCNGSRLRRALHLRPFQPEALKMTRNGFGLISIIGAGLSAFVGLATAGTAHANQLDSCGGIIVAKGEASCEYRPKEECMTSCTTAEVQGACVAKINTMCEGGCTATATVECESSCTDSCTTSCTEQETPPTCEEICTADCKEDFCAGFCDDDGQCNACCGTNCDRKCDRKCEGVEDPEPETACMTNCTEACSGSCSAQASTECHLDCQTEVYEECETEMVETCTTTCEDKGGALFCDGQFVSASDIDDCAADLEAELDIDIEIEIEGSVDVDINGGDDCDDGEEDCDNDNESVGEEIDKACTVSSVRPTTLGGSAGAFAAIAALAFVRTRRRNGR